jgi:hypothetical protein
MRTGSLGEKTFMRRAVAVAQAIACLCIAGSCRMGWTGVSTSDSRAERVAIPMDKSESFARAAGRRPGRPHDARGESVTIGQ